MSFIAKIKYNPKSGGDMRALSLNFGSEGDGFAGLAEQRRETLVCLVHEAQLQGVRLAYSDLSIIMLTSLATLKRDVRYLRDQGYTLSIGRNPGQVGY